jgi:hypothetical protein
MAAFPGVSFLDDERKPCFKLGFSDVEETAIGATIVKKRNTTNFVDDGFNAM